MSVGESLGTQVIFITHAYSKCFVDKNPKQGLILGFMPVKTPINKQKIVQMEKIYQKFK